MIISNYKIGKRMVKCYVPMTEEERERGLFIFGTDLIPDDQGMLFLPPCKLHTHGMKYAIDVIEIDPQQTLWPADMPGSEPVRILSKTRMIPPGCTLQESFRPLIELAGGWCYRNLDKWRG